MKKYYDQLHKIQEWDNFSRSDLIDYIHHQKTEAAIQINITPDLWVALDYIIHLTEAVLKKPKIEAEKDFKNIIKPIFDKYNSRIDRILRKIPEEEYCFLKRDLKSFHHLISHSINLIHKGLPHFLPSYLFISTIENMSVLYPLHEKTCDWGTLMRGNYPVLISRHISKGFTDELTEIINYLIWLKAILPHAIPEDRAYLRKKMLTMLEGFASNKHEFKTDIDYSTKSLVIELREVITRSFIQEQILDLIEKIKDPEVRITIQDCLDHIASIFIDIEKVDPTRTTIRDLTVVIELAGKIVESVKQETRPKLMNYLLTFKALRPFFLSVSRYMLDPKIDLELCRLIETVDYMYESHPCYVSNDQLGDILDESMKVLETEREVLCATSAVTPDKEANELFVAKMIHIYAKS